MNILVPDSWLRKFLDTKTTPSQIKEYLSLCGPSVERIYEETGEPVYDIEITTNRPDAMSVAGIAREASVILPRFGIPATLLHDPYAEKKKPIAPKNPLPLEVVTDPVLNPRWTSIVLSDVTVGASPRWLSDWLEKTGIRPINAVVDVTNYLMRAYGQPAHAFDYDRIGKKSGVPYMKLRESKKGEKLRTLDGKTHTLPGGDIVIEDGTGRLIDLCGIMGGENSAITTETKRVILFLQTYEPVHIRRTSMALAHRTEAASLFEKGTDSELVMPALLSGVSLLSDIAGAKTASAVNDLYPKPFAPYAVSVKREKADSYIHAHLSDREIRDILTPLGFAATVTASAISVKVPSFRRDVTIDVDVIEELARIYGYHTIASRLPEGEMPDTLPDPGLTWEREVKTRLRDWGYTEMITYSMISKKQVEAFGFDTAKAYRIDNPLSEDWVYMRPHAIASLLPVFIENTKQGGDLKVFELSMSYIARPGDLPEEKPVLNVLWTGERFLEAKGLAETIFGLMGMDIGALTAGEDPQTATRYTGEHLRLGEYASLGILDPAFTAKLGARTPVTRLYINFGKLVSEARPVARYVPIPKHPPSSEDLSFVVPERFEVGRLLQTLSEAHPFVYRVELLDVHGNTRTVHVTYLNPEKTLTSGEITDIRNKLLAAAREKLHVSLRTS